MKCQEAEKSILLQGADELGARKKAQLENHLGSCPACREFKQLMIDSSQSLEVGAEPSIKTIQNVLRVARQNVPTKEKSVPLMMLKPALGLTFAIMVMVGILSTNSGDEPQQPQTQKSMVLVMNEAQLLEPEQQVVQVMYNGLTDDNLAFDFLMMSYEETDEIE